MKPATLMMFGVICASASISYAEDTHQTQHMEESRQTAQIFMQSLAGQLKAALESVGAEHAIKVCKEIAPALAQQFSTDGKRVTRVSLKPRNPTMGVPDKDELAILERFDSLQKEGTAANTLESGVFQQHADGSQWFHYMKAIPTQAICLQCHGKPQDISDQVKALLSKEYPADQAIGYTQGEIRGAVSIRTPVH